MQSRAARNAMLWVRHTYEVLGTVKDLGVVLDNASAEERGFLLTGDGHFLEPYQSAAERVAPLEARLRRLTADNPSQQDRLLALSPLVQRRLAEWSRAIDTRRERGLDASLRLLDAERGRSPTTEVDSILAGFAQEEERLLAERLANADRSSQRALWLAVASFAAGVALLALS
ncbi:MAG: CHASE3 domain-containing protein, partial [Acetobacteraceae bacterium]|nr:CHASE3 domain-containing protein [Acetobacteraceae bacterium]